MPTKNNPSSRGASGASGKRGVSGGRVSRASFARATRSGARARQLRGQRVGSAAAQADAQEQAQAAATAEAQAQAEPQAQAADVLAVPSIADVQGQPTGAILRAADLAGRAMDNISRRLDTSPRAKVDASAATPGGATEAFRLVNRAKRPKRDRHARRKVGVLRYGYYNIAFKFFVEQVLDADYVTLPEPTRRTVELGSANSNDFVCAPFKHILGDYIEALELGADVLVQVMGPCRLGYYGELQESILRDMGYEFDMLNFATVTGKPLTEYIKVCQKKVNPDMSIPNGVAGMLATFKMIEDLDAYNDFYLAHAGFEAHPGEYARARKDFFANMNRAETRRDIEDFYTQGMAALRAIELDVPTDPVRVGLVGEFFTAVDPAGNLYVEDKLAAMGVSLARMLTMTNRNLRYNEPNLRRSIPEYANYDMGPTSTMTIAAAKAYAEAGFDGIVHMKSTGCTPEVDCMPALQRISREYGVPVLFLSYDSQTSDTGLDTRLEAFYDMIAMRKAR